jgi:urease accessory protein
MNITRHVLPVVALTLLATSGVASAHVGHPHQSFADGAVHPVTGLDHILAMIGVGLWAAQLGGRAKWIVPAAFVGSMVIGGIVQWMGVNIPQVETGIATSVLVLGLLIATSFKLPIWAASTVVGLFAICHGAAHAGEFEGSSAVLYSVGFVIATAMLHAVGIALGLMMSKAKADAFVRVAGGAMAACAVLIFTGVL